MNLPDMPLFSILRERMTWLNQRQGILSENVANADTPGYVAHDLKPIDFSDVLRSTTETKGSNLLVTDPRHITIRPADTMQFDTTESREVESGPNGNSVSLEQEMIKVSDTQSQFQAAANLYAKAMSMMKIAIGQP